jgi:hypothetical protein
MNAIRITRFSENGALVLRNHQRTETINSETFVYPLTLLSYFR